MFIAMFIVVDLTWKGSHKENFPVFSIFAFISLLLYVCVQE